MAKNKTTETNENVAAYLQKIPDEKRRQDCTEIVKLMCRLTKLEAKMWGAAIVGFGSYHYKYESGHEGDAPLIGLASRANAITLYLGTFKGREELLKQFGKHKTGKSCIYIQKLDDIDIDVLGKMIINATDTAKSLHSC